MFDIHVCIILMRLLDSYRAAVHNFMLCHDE